MCVCVCVCACLLVCLCVCVRAISDQDEYRIGWCGAQGRCYPYTYLPAQRTQKCCTLDFAALALRCAELRCILLLLLFLYGVVLLTLLTHCAYLLLVCACVRVCVTCARLWCPPHTHTPHHHHHHHPAPCPSSTINVAGEGIGGCVVIKVRACGPVYKCAISGNQRIYVWRARVVQYKLQRTFVRTRTRKCEDGKSQRGGKPCC